MPKVNIYLTKQFVRCSVYCVCVSGYGWCPEAGVVLYVCFDSWFPGVNVKVMPPVEVVL